MSELTISERIRKAKLLLQKISLDLEAIAADVDSKPSESEMEYVRDLVDRVLCIEDSDFENEKILLDS